MDDQPFWQRPPRVQLCVIMPRALKRGLRFREHTHVFHELAFLLDGECHWHVGGRREHLRAGDLLLVPAGTRHHETALVRHRPRIGWIGFDFTDGRSDVPPALCRALSSGEYAIEFRRLFEVVNEERRHDAPGHRERTELALREILILLCRLSPAGETVATRPTPPAKPRRAGELARSAALMLTSNLAQPMRIRDLAHYHSLSAAHLARLFRQHLGKTPLRFLREARLERAQTLLAAGTLNIKEIAAACGYADAAHFSHAFKTHLRLTPKQYRRQRRA